MDAQSREGAVHRLEQVVPARRRARCRCASAGGRSPPLSPGRRRSLRERECTRPCGGRRGRRRCRGEALAREFRARASSKVLPLDVGILGCGRMGGAMARHLLAARTPLAVYDPAPEACAPLVELGAVACASPAEVAARSELVLIVVVDDAQAREAVRACLERAPRGAILAVCASVRPDTCRALADEAEASGVRVIDAALVRGERGAEEGRLALFCGGPEDVIDAIRPGGGARSRRMSSASATSVRARWRRRRTTSCSGHASAPTWRRSGSDGRWASSRPRCARRWPSGAAPTGRSRSGESIGSAGHARTSRSRWDSRRRPASRLHCSRPCLRSWRS